MVQGPRSVREDARLRGLVEKVPLQVGVDRLKDGYEDGTPRSASRLGALVWLHAAENEGKRRIRTRLGQVPNAVRTRLIVTLVVGCISS